MEPGGRLHAPVASSWQCLPSARAPAHRAAHRVCVKALAAKRRPLVAVVTELQRAQQQLQELADLIAAQEELSSSSSSESEAEAEAQAPTLTSLPVPEFAPSILQEATAASSVAELQPLLQSSGPAPVLAQSTRHVQVCTGKACRKRGSEAMLAALQAQAETQPGVSVTSCKCLDQCKAAPNVQLSDVGRAAQLMTSVQPLHYADILGQLVPA